MSPEINVSGDGGKSLPAIFISHGGGPSFLMDMGKGASQFERMLAPMDKNSGTCSALRSFVETELGGVRPRAVVVISAHHEARHGHEVMPQDDGRPGLYYDYGGFPPEFYNLPYSPPGSASVASEVLDALEAAGVPVAGGRKARATRKQRGYDHGVFIPLMQMFPDPPPIVQVSLDSGMDSAVHMRLGAALSPLRRRGILIVCSGAIVHNPRASMSALAGGPPLAWFAPFSRWVNDVVSGGEDDAAARKARANALREWGKQPWAKHAHPREDHLLPLHVAATAGSGNADSVPRAKIVFMDNQPSIGFLSGIIRYD